MLHDQLLYNGIACALRPRRCGAFGTGSAHIRVAALALGDAAGFSGLTGLLQRALRRRAQLQDLPANLRLAAALDSDGALRLLLYGVIADCLETELNLRCFAAFLLQSIGDVLESDQLLILRRLRLGRLEWLDGGRV